MRSKKELMSIQYRKDALIIFFLLAFTFGYFYQIGGWKWNSRFDLIFAIVREGRLTIDTFQHQLGTNTRRQSLFQRSLLFR